MKLSLQYGSRTIDVKATPELMSTYRAFVEVAIKELSARSGGFRLDDPFRENILISGNGYIIEHHQA